MQIAIDARELLGHSTGVGRYLRGLVEQWTQDVRLSGHQLILIVASNVEPKWTWLGSTGAAVRVVALSGSGNTLWEQWTLPRALRRIQPDVLFAPAYSAPLLATCPVVVALHDLSFFAHPEWFTWREGVRRRWLARLSAHRARAVVTISQFSLDEIVRRLRVPSRRIVVAPPGADHLVREGPQNRGPSGRAIGPRVLYVGSIFNRRHLPTLIEAFASVRIRYPGASLTVIGENRTHPFEALHDHVARLGLRDAVVLRSYVAREELDRAYDEADAFVFVSEYEGFGIPPVEATVRGIPVVAADTPVSREVLQDGALYVRPGRVRELSEALLSVLSDTDDTRERLGAARRAVARYRWDHTAAQVFDLLRRSARDAR